MVNGILLLDKPQGLSSNAAVQRVRRAFGRIKAGHTGSLDPLATGMLPVCLGEATKVAGFLLDGDKCYEFTARFGARTATGDLEGPGGRDGAGTGEPRRCVARRCMPAVHRSHRSRCRPCIRRSSAMASRFTSWRARASKWSGRARSDRDPPAGAAGSHGQRRHGLRVRCSKGTYVRTLAEDLARALGSCAHLVMLRRTAVLPFDGQPMVTLAQVQADPDSRAPAGAGCCAAAFARRDPAAGNVGPVSPGAGGGPSGGASRWPGEGLPRGRAVPGNRRGGWRGPAEAGPYFQRFRRTFSLRAGGRAVRMPRFPKGPIHGVIE